jgi:TolB protein
MWRFLGRVGLALRNTLYYLVWDPFLFLTAPFRFILRPAWRFLGRMGLATRTLLTLVTNPLVFLARWFYLKLLNWIWARIWARIRATWQAGAPRRALIRRRVGSRWAVARARFRVLLYRPKPPEGALTAPRTPRPAFSGKRFMRIATVSISVSLVLVLSLVSQQDRSQDQVSAGSIQPPEIIIVTPTPALSPPSPNLKPAIEVKLTPWPTPDPLNGGGTLVFDHRTGGNEDIYLLPVGTSELIRLTSHPADDREPAWSPNGQQIAFSSRRDGNWEIYVYNFSRGKLTRISDELSFQGNPSWSPDGQWLIYESYEETNLDIYIIKVDLSEGPYRLTQDPALDFSPVWAPGGRHVAYVSRRNGSKDLFLLSLDEPSDEFALNLTNSPDVHEEDPSFSPDGSFLSFSANEAGLDLIYALPLSDDYLAAGPARSLGQQGSHPAWSPDGKSLMFTHSQGNKHFLVGGSIDGWGVAPQAFVGEGPLSNPSWLAINLSPELADKLGSIDPPEPPQPLYVEDIAAGSGEASSTRLFEMAVSAPAPFLSDQVDQSFKALQQRVALEAGWDFLGRLDNMFEPIESKPLPGQDQPSWNKAGRAFDLYYREAMAFEPRLEMVRHDTGSGIFWRAYIRTTAQDGSLGEPLRDFPWDFSSRYGDEPRYYEEGGKPKESIPSGYYVDFTSLAAQYGWSWVPSGERWRTYFPAIRFWHYENRQGLTWEEAMLQLYTTEEYRQAP